MKPTAYKIGEWEWKWLSKDMQEVIWAYEEEIKKLKEENETLKDKIEFLTQCLDDRDKSIELMKEENNNLKNELMEDMKTESKLNEEIRNLKSENADLKSELSKFSEAYKKYRDYEKEELAESCYDLARENEKLKEEVRGLRDTKYIHWEPTVSSWWVWGQVYIL